MNGNKATYFDSFRVKYIPNEIRKFVDNENITTNIFLEFLVFLDFFSKAKAKFCLSLHYNVNNSYLFVNGKKIFKFKADNGNANFAILFSPGSIPNDCNGTRTHNHLVHK